MKCLLCFHRMKSQFDEFIAVDTLGQERVGNKTKNI